MRNIRVAALLMGVFMLGACSGWPQKPPTVDGKPVLPKAELPGVVALNGRCLVAEVGDPYEAAAIVGALAGALVQTVVPTVANFAVEGVANYLEQRARELNASTTASSTLSHIYRQRSRDRQIVPANNCLIVARGKLGPYEKIASTDGVFNTALLRDLHPTLGLIAPPEFYAEFKIEYNKVSGQIVDEKSKKIADFSTFTEIGLKPVYVYYRQSGAKRNSEKSKRVVVEVNMEARPLVSTSGSTTVLSTTFDLGEIPFQTKLEGADLARYTPKYAKLPQPTMAKVEGVTTSPTGAARKANAEVLDLVPVTAMVSVTESEDGGDLERALAEAFRTNKQKFADPLTTYVDERVKAWLKIPNKPATP